MRSEYFVFPTQYPFLFSIDYKDTMMKQHCMFEQLGRSSPSYKNQESGRFNKEKKKAY